MQSFLEAIIRWGRHKRGAVVLTLHKSLGSMIVLYPPDGIETVGRYPPREPLQAPCFLPVRVRILVDF